MKSVYQVRRQYGSVYATFFKDYTVPWKPLSVEDYINYSRDSQRGVHPLAQYEDEIFTRCVLDATLVRQLDFLPAGLVSVVAQNIWEHSGPIGIDGFNKDLEEARQELHARSYSIFHQLIRIITLAFPYKPEEIYAMDYKTFLMRVVQSEDKLLQAGVIKEPLVLQDTSNDNAQAKKPKVDLKRLWEFQQELQKKKQNSQSNPENKPVATATTSPTSSASATPGGSNRTHRRESPILEHAPSHGISFSQEGKEIDFFVPTGHEKTDLHIRRAKMLESAKIIYKDVIDKVAQKHSK